MAASLKSTSDGATLVLTISNPEQHNALGPEIYAAGVEAINAAETNPDVRSVVIAGEGSTFSDGGNLHRLKAVREGQLELQRQSLESLNSWIEAIGSFPKPVIAAVEGAAAGAGFSLVLACDFVVAADSAYFLMAHSKIGLSPDGGGCWQLARALPRPLVSDAVMRGTRLSAASVWQRLQRRSQLAHTSAPVHPHMLRHSFASHVLQSSSDLRGVQELLGHSNISTTQVYTRLDFQHLAKAYDAAHPRAKTK
jgi:enoyl-CoA hydratase/carnithine racemase